MDFPLKYSESYTLWQQHSVILFVNVFNFLNGKEVILRHYSKIPSSTPRWNRAASIQVSPKHPQRGGYMKRNKAIVANKNVAGIK